MRLSNDSLISAPVDLSTPWTSDPIWCGTLYAMSVSLAFNGIPEGTFRLECSNDKGQEGAGVSYASGVTNWTAIEGSSQLIDEAGDHTWAVSDVSWRWLRVRWIPSAGTSTLTSARFNAKGS